MMHVYVAQRTFTSFRGETISAQYITIRISSSFSFSKFVYLCVWLFICVSGCLPVISSISFVNAFAHMNILTLFLEHRLCQKNLSGSRSGLDLTLENIETKSSFFMFHNLHQSISQEKKYKFTLQDSDSFLDPVSLEV